MIKANSTIEEVRVALENLPIDLEDAYEKTFDMICSRGKHFLPGATRALIWAVHARRPLSRAEFKHALAIERVLDNVELDQEQRFHYDQFNQEREETVISWCMGLIVIDEQTQVVRLIRKQSLLDIWYPTH